MQYLHTCMIPCMYCTCTGILTIVFLLSGSCEPIDTIAYKLQQHRFPPHKWRVLATCLHMASVVDEIDTDERHVRDKLQALVVCWVSTAGSAEQGNLWETLVEAVYMCEEKVIAIKLAEEMGVTYPGSGMYRCL